MYTARETKIRGVYERGQGDEINVNIVTTTSEMID